MRIVIIFTLAFAIHLSAGESKTDFTFIDRLRSFVAASLGEEFATKIFGLDEGQLAENKIVLPTLPVLTSDAKSTDIFKAPQDPIKLSLEKTEKFDMAYIAELYDTTRLLKANRDDVAKWMNVIVQGGNREGIYRSLVLDETYLSLENENRPINSKSADYVTSLYKKYFNKELDKEKLKGANIFAIKRVATEKGLEMIDALALKSRSDLENWYAVYSAEVGQNYKNVWTNESRRNSTKMFHQSWAKQVPIQFIKSEFIIKNHMILNSLNQLR